MVERVMEEVLEVRRKVMVELFSCIVPGDNISCLENYTS